MSGQILVLAAGSGGEARSGEILVCMATNGGSSSAGISCSAQHGLIRQPANPGYHEPFRQFDIAIKKLFILTNCGFTKSGYMIVWHRCNTFRA